jgi:hypothetical protein
MVNLKFNANALDIRTVDIWVRSSLYFLSKYLFFESLFLEGCNGAHRHIL